MLWHFTMSLDGFVAGPNHAMDWMTGFSIRPGLVEQYAETTGAVLGGRDGFDVYPDVSGIYGGDPHQLSVQAVLPRFVELAARVTGTPWIASVHAWHSVWPGLSRKRRWIEAVIGRTGATRWRFDLDPAGFGKAAPAAAPVPADSGLPAHAGLGGDLGWVSSAVRGVAIADPSACDRIVLRSVHGFRPGAPRSRHAKLKTALLAPPQPGPARCA